MLRLYITSASYLFILGCQSSSPGTEGAAKAGEETTESDCGESIGPSGKEDTGTGVASTDGDTGGLMDTGVASSDPIEEALPAYCEDAPSHVICDPAVNFDTWWEYSGGYTFDTLTETTISVPFTLRESELDGGQLHFTTVEGAAIDGSSFRAWFSSTPGGPPLAPYDVSNCDAYMAQARGGMYWTQNPANEGHPSYCSFGSEPRVLYANFEVCTFAEDSSCIDERHGGYRFHASRRYRQY